MKIEEYIEGLIYDLVDDNFESEQIIEAFKKFDVISAVKVAIDDKLQG